MAGNRKNKVSDQLMGCLAEEIRRMEDPRLKSVTLTGVEMSNDLKFAKVYWSAYAADPLAVEAQPAAALRFLEDEEVKAVSAALSGAAGFLRRKIAETLSLRYVPQLRFHFDGSGKVGSRIDELLKRAGADGAN